MLKQLITTPFQKFVRIESLSGLLLFIATILAIIWVNSPISNTYHSFFQSEIGFNFPGFELSKPLLLWINDGLMAIFFFLIGLEIKRELLIGELNSMRKAAFPLFAAVGGMVIPLSLFLILNRNPETAKGWGIPMATDIAFALAILKLLGNRIPVALKVFLTAFAIADDIGAVIVIALFYSSAVKWSMILYGMSLFTLLMILSQRRIYFRFLTFTLGLVIWFLFLKSGIHPTVAGILLAFTIPLSRKIEVGTYVSKLSQIADDIRSTGDPGMPILSKLQIGHIDDLEDWTEMVQSPLQRLEHQLHSWVAYLIMPLFALANTGIEFSGTSNLNYPLVINLALSLILGKSVGIALFSALALQLRVADLPSGTNFTQVIGVSFLAGIGFTMSIFIGTLAFSGNLHLTDSAKLGILAGSLASGVIGYLILRFSKHESAE